MTPAFRKEMSAEMRKMISDLFHFLTQHPRGVLLHWEQIEEVAQCKRGQMLYDALRRARKRLLKQCKIATWARRDVGLRLLTHLETLKEIPAQRQARAGRQINRGLRELDTVDIGKLNRFDRQRLGMERMQMQQSRRELYRGRRRTRAADNGVLYKPTESLPRRPEPK